MDVSINALNNDICTKEERLLQIVQMNEHLSTIFNGIEERLPYEYYIGAGCLVQTVWNYLSEYPLDYGIHDVDIVYFDREDLSEESEMKIENDLSAFFTNIPYKIDVKNEARVHLWYETKFGFNINPYQSVEDAIHTWPTTATSIGIRKEKGAYKVYAPFGLNDIFEMVIRANKTQITKEIFESKAHKWNKLWPKLTIIPWES